MNTEKDDEILSRLPGIGPKRATLLKKKRPFHDLDDVLDARIGIGLYWSGKWQTGIDRGTIVFD